MMMSKDVYGLKGDEFVDKSPYDIYPGNPEKFE